MARQINGHWSNYDRDGIGCGDDLAQSYRVCVRKDVGPQS